MVRRTVPPIAAFAVAVLGIGLFSVMDAVMKSLILVLGTFTALFWRSLAGVVISGGLYAGSRPSRPTRAAMRLHLARGVVSTVMTVCFFWGLARVPLAQAVALTFVAPVLSLFLAAAVLDEPVRPAALVASVMALAGVAVILGGQVHAVGGAAAHPARLAGSAAILASALCYAVNIVLMRSQALVAGPVEVTFWQSLVVAVLLVPAAPFLWMVPDAGRMAVIGGAAGLAVASLLLMAWAYARAGASLLSFGEYTAFIWASLLGWLVFAEPVSSVTLAGAGLIVAGCAVANRRVAPAVAVV